MKNKTIIIISTCLVFTLAAFSAVAGDWVYIHKCSYAGVGEIRVFDGGTSKSFKVKNGWIKNGEAYSPSAQIFNEYLNRGYKVVDAIPYSDWCIEYILAK